MGTALEDRTNDLVRAHRIASQELENRTLYLERVIKAYLLEMAELREEAKYDEGQEKAIVALQETIEDLQIERNDLKNGLENLEQELGDAYDAERAARAAARRAKDRADKELTAQRAISDNLRTMWAKISVDSDKLQRELKTATAILEKERSRAADLENHVATALELMESTHLEDYAILQCLAKVSSVLCSVMRGDE